MENKQILNFVMHKVKTVEQTMSEEPAYIGWCIEKGINFNLSKEQIEKAEDELRHERAMSEAIFESEHGDWGDRD